MSCAAAGGLTRMTSITAQTHATLDGVIDAPPADALLPYMSDAGRQGALDLALAADALLLARETWQGLARAWRDQTGPMAERLNAMPKYVVSATLGSADEWDHTTIVGYDDIAGLREREQLLTYGCGRLARDLLTDGLLDVLVLSLTPVVAGAGRRLFDDPGHLLRLRLTTARPSRPAPCGCSLRPIKPDRSYNRVPLGHAKRAAQTAGYSSEAAVRPTRDATRVPRPWRSRADRTPGLSDLLGAVASAASQADQAAGAQSAVARMTSEALMTAVTSLPSWRASSRAASTVMEATRRWPLTSISTLAIAAPSVTLLMVPASWLRALSFMVDAPVVGRHVS